MVPVEEGKVNFNEELQFNLGNREGAVRLEVRRNGRNSWTHYHEQGKVFSLDAARL